VKEAKKRREERQDVKRKEVLQVSFVLYPHIIFKKSDIGDPFTRIKLLLRKTSRSLVLFSVHFFYYVSWTVCLMNVNDSVVMITIY
jgi:hypothetical protein